MPTRTSSPQQLPQPVAAAIYLPVGELRPNPRNPRMHGEEVARLARTILRTAWGAPIVAQARSRRIIGGHGRLEAALLILGGLVVDGEPRGGAEHLFDRDAPGPGMVPVRLVDVSDAEADAMTVADNAAALQGVDDSVRVLEMLSQFGRGTELLDDMGYGDAVLDGIVQHAGDLVLAAADADEDAAAAEHTPVVEDEAPVERAEELRAKWGTERGQLWVIPSAHGGEHRLLCGDATSPADVARALAGEQAAWMWTDPPYGVSYEGKTADALTIENDGADGLDALLRGSFAAADGALVEGAPIYVAHPAGALSFSFAAAWRAVGWRWHQTLVWVKQTFVLGHADYHYQHEPLLYGWKGKNRPWYGGRTQASVLPFDKPARNGEHPTMKPVALVAACIENSSARGSRGLEPFSGSGTTLVASEQTGRLVSALELAPKYVAVALERLALLGLSPRLAS